MTAARSKSQAAFRTISEVADELEVAQHVLRFWESKFPQVRPLKRGGGRRYYRPEDIELLRDIRSLLYDEGYTIKGAQKLLRQRRAKPAPAAKPAAATAQPQLEGTAPAASSTASPPAAAAPAADAPSPEPAPAADAPVADAPTANAPGDSVPGDNHLAPSDLQQLRQVRASLQELRQDLGALLEAADG